MKTRSWRATSRWSLGFLAVLVAAVGLAPMAPSASADTVGPLLFPNLKTLPPRHLTLERADVSVDSTGDMHNVLRFSNSEWNAGPGRLELRSKIDPTTQS